VTEDALVYGEVDFNGMAVIIIDQILPLIPPNSVFYDIGSGITSHATSTPTLQLTKSMHVM
jgi:hypothetical protein